VNNATPLGLRCDILISHHHRANGGISETAHQVTLMHPDLAELTEKRAERQLVTPLCPATPEAPAVTACLLSDMTIVAWPQDLPDDDQHIGPMASGAWIVCDNDWRWTSLFRHSQPIALHDRFEIGDTYRSLSI